MRHAAAFYARRELVQNQQQRLKNALLAAVFIPKKYGRKMICPVIALLLYSMPHSLSSCFLNFSFNILKTSPLTLHTFTQVVFQYCTDCPLGPVLPFQNNSGTELCKVTQTNYSFSIVDPWHFLFLMKTRVWWARPFSGSSYVEVCISTCDYHESRSIHSHPKMFEIIFNTIIIFLEKKESPNIMVKVLKANVHTTYLSFRQM